MVALNFPDSPTNGQEYEGYVYDSTKTAWVRSPEAPAIALDAVSDVTITTPSDGQALVYDSASGDWVNETPVSTLLSLTDVTITDPADGQALTYDDSSGEWINSTIPTPPSSIDDLDDVSAASPADGQTLVYVSSSGNWVADDFPSEYSFNAQTTNYSLVLSDAGKIVEMSSGSAISLTVPLDSSENFPIGTSITVLQTGIGEVTIVPTSGVVVEATPGLRLRTQWSIATLIKRAADSWVAIGDLAA